MNGPASLLFLNQVLLITGRQPTNALGSHVLAMKEVPMFLYDRPNIRFNFRRRPLVEFDDCCLEEGQYYTHAEQQLENIVVNGQVIKTFDKGALQPGEFLCLLRDIMNAMPEGKKQEFSSDHVYAPKLPMIFSLLGADVEVNFQDHVLTRQDILNNYKQGKTSLADTERLLDLLSQGISIAYQE